MNKFHADTVQTEQDRWLKFFKDGEQLDPDALPTWMDTDEMRQAMSTLKAFSDKDRAYHAYQARQNYLREQRSIQRHMEELKAETEQQRAALEQERAAKEQERTAKEAALAELARLKAQLHHQSHTDSTPD
ncbi:MAG: Rpn family recombination-promoting nuclease/putative transposase [Chromatiales bacterium]|nr:Rpn family recombination-promoting nuclease/putative transposase [Chromatiales bacterium]